jgi:RNA polymerase sigma factor (sigma-70 family)
MKVNINNNLSITYLSGTLIAGVMSYVLVLSFLRSSGIPNLLAEEISVIWLGVVLAAVYLSPPFAREWTMSIRDYIFASFDRDALRRPIEREATGELLMTDIGEVVGLAKLLEQAGEGQVLAAESVYREARRRLLHPLAARLARLHDAYMEAESIVNESVATLIEMARHSRVDGDRNGWGYLYIMSMNKAIDRLRRERRRVGAEAEWARSQGATTAEPMEGLVEENERSIRLREAIRTLTPDEQTLLALRYVQEHSQRAIAGLLGKSPAAVSTTLASIRRKLATNLDVLES